MTLHYVDSPLTNSPVEIADFLIDLMHSNRKQLGIAENAIYYGDQEKIPFSPAICIEPDMTVRKLDASPRRTEMTVRIYILLYHGELRNPEFNRRNADLRTEAVSKIVHENPYMGGRVIHSYITEVQSGYSTKQNSVMRTSRMQFEATTHDYLPMEVQ